jgi:hypothetical protein
MIVALFDADGTLYTGQFGRGLMKYSSVLSAFSQAILCKYSPAYAIQIKLAASHAYVLRQLKRMLRNSIRTSKQPWPGSARYLPTQRPMYSSG